MSICNPSCCSALNFFYRFYIVCRMWVPDNGPVLQDWADKGFICCFLIFLFPIFRFLLRKPSVLFALLVMVSMWSPQFRLSCMYPCKWHDGTIFFFFRVALNV